MLPVTFRPPGDTVYCGAMQALMFSSPKSIIMLLKHFTTRLSPESLPTDQEAINRFMETVTVKKTATQFVPGNPDYWSILVFYEAHSAATPKAPAKTASDPETPLTEEEQQILQALRIWRKDRAAELSQPEFMICHNATLANVVRARPQTINDLSGIKGLGAQKIARYGDDLIAILNAF